MHRATPTRVCEEMTDQPLAKLGVGQRVSWSATMEAIWAVASRWTSCTRSRRHHWFTLYVMAHPALMTAPRASRRSRVLELGFESGGHSTGAGGTLAAGMTTSSSGWVVWKPQLS